MPLNQLGHQLLRGIYNDYNRFIDTYLAPYAIISPVMVLLEIEMVLLDFGWSDVVNVSGHRLSTAEIEAALIEHPIVGESAVVGYADELTGQTVAAYVSLKKDASLGRCRNIKNDFNS